MYLSKMAHAAGLVAVLIATPAFSQPAIQEPGAVAFYHPGAEVLNSGEAVRIQTSGTMALAPFGDGSAYDSYAYYEPAYRVRHGRTIARGAATWVEVAPSPPQLNGPACIPAPRVGAFATQPWDTQPPCEPLY